jgi:16S rRNA (guanine527-N7)-methyltransferase
MKTWLTQYYPNLAERAAQRFDAYYAFLSEYNAHTNLTAVSGRAETDNKHFIDSLLGAELVPPGAAVLDIGSGAGFPGVPVRIVRPDIKLTLLDSVKKKVDFLTRLLALLELDGCAAVHGRIEDFPLREGFDCVISRAVAPLRTLAEYALPFVRPGGVFIAYKGQTAPEELAAAGNALKILGGVHEQTVEKDLDAQTRRRLVVIKKRGHCPAKYPRAKNRPRLQPL